MTMAPRARQPQLLTVTATALSVAAVALIAAACGSSASRSSSSGSRDQAIAYAQCVRKNGVPNFPDPDAEGRFRGVGHEQESNPQFQAAMDACRDLVPGGEHEKLGDPAFVDQMRAFSQCMRENGLLDFPDPDAEGRLRGVGHEQQDSPAFRAAMQSCRAKLPGGGEHR